jgi:hypothetical protein
MNKRIINSKFIFQKKNLNLIFKLSEENKIKNNNF